MAWEILLRPFADNLFISLLIFLFPPLFFNVFLNFQSTFILMFLNLIFLSRINHTRLRKQISGFSRHAKGCGIFHGTQKTVLFTARKNTVFFTARKTTKSGHAWVEFRSHSFLHLSDEFLIHSYSFIPFILNKQVSRYPFHLYSFIPFIPNKQVSRNYLDLAWHTKEIPTAHGMTFYILLSRVQSIGHRDTRLYDPTRGWSSFDPELRTLPLTVYTAAFSYDLLSI